MKRMERPCAWSSMYQQPFVLTSRNPMKHLQIPHRQSTRWIILASCPRQGVSRYFHAMRGWSWTSSMFTSVCFLHYRTFAVASQHNHRTISCSASSTRSWLLRPSSRLHRQLCCSMRSPALSAPMQHFGEPKLLTDSVPVPVIGDRAALV